MCVCAFLRIPPSRTVYFTKEAIYDDVREIKRREREANRRRCWKEANFILAGNGWPEGRWLFLYSRCSLENGLSSGFLCEHKSRQWRDCGCPGARLTLSVYLCLYICMHAYTLRRLEISGHLSKQTSLCTCLCTRTLVFLKKPDFLYVCMSVNVLHVCPDPLGDGGRGGPGHSVEH